MTIEGVDFSWGRPGGAALVAAGKHFVIRYVPYSGAGGKGLTASEVADYRAHGLDIAFNFEQTSTRMKQGKAAGVADATTSKAAAQALGFPDTCAVYFSADWDATSADYPAIDAYLKGAASVLGASRIGVYGHYRLMAHCHGAGTAAWFWQSYAWSYGALSSYAHLYQYNNGEKLNGADVDLDHALRNEFGQWHGTLSPQSSTEADVTTIVTIQPLDTPRTFTTKAGLTALRRFTATGEDDALVAPYSAAIDAYVGFEQSDGRVPHGPLPGFLRLASGGSAGYYIAATQVDLAPLPPAPVADCTAAIAAAIAALPADISPFTQADIDAAKASGVEAEKADIRSRLGV